MQAPGFRQYMLGQMAGREISNEELAEIMQKGDEGLQVSDEVLAKGRQAALRMIGARKESMLGSLEMVDRVWGGAEAYLRKVVGLGDEELEGLDRKSVV